MGHNGNDTKIANKNAALWHRILGVYHRARPRHMRSNSRELQLLAGSDEQEASRLRMFQFDGATIEWLTFVGANRHSEKTDKHDIVRGPGAPDARYSTHRRVRHVGGQAGDGRARMVSPFAAAAHPCVVFP